MACCGKPNVAPPFQNSSTPRPPTGLRGLIQSFRPSAQADPKVVASRRAVCVACEKRVLAFCTKCGCPIRNKTSVAAATCPVDKWPA